MVVMSSTMSDTLCAFFLHVGYDLDIQHTRRLSQRFEKHFGSLNAHYVMSAAEKSQKYQKFEPSMRERDEDSELRHPERLENRKVSIIAIAATAMERYVFEKCIYRVS